MTRGSAAAAGTLSSSRKNWDKLRSKKILLYLMNGARSFLDKGAAKTRIKNKIFLLPNDFDHEGCDPALVSLPNLHRRNAMV